MRRLVALLIVLTWIAPSCLAAEVDNETLSLGRDLYEGARAYATAPQLVGVSMPATSMACVNCHGVRGEGKREADVDAPPLQWHRLTAARDGQPGFADEAAIAHAIESGVGRQVRVLRAPMPQFALTDQERTALLAYLRVLGTDSRPVAGVTPDRIALGSVLPLSGPRASVGRAIEQTLQTRLAELNQRGGLFGRQLTLRVADGGNEAGSALAAARGLMNEGVFALVASLSSARPGDLLALAQDHAVPLVSTLGVPLENSPDAYLTYLLPSLASQTEHLLDALLAHCDSRARGVLVLHAPTPALRQLARHAAEGSSGARAVWVESVADEAQLNAALRAHPAGTVIGLLPPAQAAALRKKWRKASDSSCLGTLAVVSGNPAHSVGEALPSAQIGSRVDLIALPMPALAQSGNAAMSEAQFWLRLTDLAVLTLAEALARAGRDLDAPSLIQALGTLRAYEPAPGFALTFSAQQHHGLSVAYLWRGDDHEPANSSP
ncbi:MAG: hypothetical protein A2580_09115 [Hydrogenophilales bacterium RIFOXYD1_FULL_62_11]|nr:MAG: hypothetical protein A2580_09115 [Hydrogenophilales bacterium RIFOXYD1_FULL_62_11]